jgi:hypothetical protein
MAFGQDFLKGFFGVDSLRDYTHASKVFRTDGYQRAPRNKFLFHVYLTINQNIPGVSAVFGKDIATLGLLVKNIQLPNYTLSVDTVNQYNRKRLIQTKIDYNPVVVEFHDDGGDQTRNLWYNYFAYYYKDPSQKYDPVANTNGSMGPLIGTPAGFDYNARDTYSQSRPVNDWGYIGESYSSGQGKLPFFQDIRVYGFDQHKWVQYVLVNPMITDWQHDTYDYTQGNGIMSNRMTIKYETVKYYSGAIGRVRPDTNAQGFADPAYYDTILSPISRPGSQATVLGQGGLIDAGVGIIEDLQSGGVAGVVGAIQKAGATYNTFKGKNIQAIVVDEAKQAATTVLKQGLPGAVRAVIGTTGTTTPGAGNPVAQRGALDGLLFPTPPRGNANNTGVTSPVGTYNPGFAPTGPGRTEV